MLGAGEGTDLCHVAILSAGVVRTIGGPSAGVGTPFEAAVACFVGPDGQRAADDRTARQRPKVPTVHAVRRIPVHEEEFAVGDTTAALPDRQLATGAVADAGASDRRAVGENVETIAADGLPRGPEWQEGDDTVADLRRRLHVNRAAEIAAPAEPPVR